MQGFGFLFILFGIGLILAGLYIFTGHNSALLFRWTYNPNTSKEELKNIGIYIMLSAAGILLTGIVAMFFEEENIIPVIVLIVSEVVFITSRIVMRKRRKAGE